MPPRQGRQVHDSLSAATNQSASLFITLARKYSITRFVHVNSLANVDGKARYTIVGELLNEERRRLAKDKSKAALKPIT